jgi:hypothetical protein
MGRLEDMVPDTVADKSEGTAGVPAGLIQQFAALNLPPQDPPANPSPGDIWVGRSNKPGLFVQLEDGTYKVPLQKVKQ